MEQTLAEKEWMEQIKNFFQMAKSKSLLRVKMVSHIHLSYTLHRIPLICEAQSQNGSFSTG
jgi:hypothetical protein